MKRFYLIEMTLDPFMGHKVQWVFEVENNISDKDLQQIIDGIVANFPDHMEVPDDIVELTEDHYKVLSQYLPVYDYQLKEE